MIPSAFYETAATLQGSQDAEQVATAQVSVDFFKTLGVKPALGQPFPEGISGAAFELGRFLSGERLAVISDGLWKRRFAADPSIIGKNITINGTEWEVVGVMASGSTIPSKETDIWLPWDIARTYNAQRFPQGPPRDWRFLNVIGRMNQAANEETLKSIVIILRGTRAAVSQNKSWLGRNR